MLGPRGTRAPTDPRPRCSVTRPSPVSSYICHPARRPARPVFWRLRAIFVHSLAAFSIGNSLVRNTFQAFRRLNLSTRRHCLGRRLKAEGKDIIVKWRVD